MRYSRACKQWIVVPAVLTSSHVDCGSRFAKRQGNPAPSTTAGSCDNCDLIALE